VRLLISDMEYSIDPAEAAPFRGRVFEVPDVSFIHERATDDSLKRWWTRTTRSRRPEVRLLKQHLSSWQTYELRRTGFIPVVGSKGGTWVVQVYPETMGMYRLYLDSTGHEMRQARHRCLVFPGDDHMPLLDWAISKVLLLEADESKVDRYAN
jgi:hypothetical protein